MSSAEVQAIRTAVGALNAGDVDGYLAGFSADSVRWVQGVDQPFTKDDIGEQLLALMAALEGFVLDEQLVFGSDGYVFARWLLKGTHVGPFFGLPGTGRTIEMENIEVYSFTDAAVRTSWVYGDPLALLRELEVPA